MGRLTSFDSLATFPQSTRFLDCRSPQAYALGHLPGALHADLESVLSAAANPGFDPCHGGRHPLPDPAHFAAWLGRVGIRPETPLVVYDDTRGGMGAARAWWMLSALGHQDVALLHGPLPKLEDTSVPAAPLPAPYPASPWMLPTADMALVDHARQDQAWKVLDVRSAPRWRGEVEPVDPVPGRIPGSVNRFWEENLDAQGYFKSPETLRNTYLSLFGETPLERVIVHCGSGVTACHTLLALEVAGLTGAKLYVGSYSEWCRNQKPLGKG